MTIVDERWHVFTFDGHQKVGFTQERTLSLGADADGERFATASLTTFEMDDEDGTPRVYENPFLFTFRRTAEGAQLTAYGYFGIEDGNTFHTLFVPRGGRHVKVEDGREVGTLEGDVPADTWATAAFELLFERLRPEDGSRVTFTAVHEGTGEVSGPAQLEVVTREDVVAGTDGSQRSLWRVQETINGRPGRVFWMDDDHRAQVFNWGGPLSYLVADRETALAGLPADWRTLDDFELPRELP